MRAALQRYRAELQQRLAERRAQEEAAARAAEAAAARAAGGAVAGVAEDIYLPVEAYEVWGYTQENEAACGTVRKLYAVTQLGRYGTVCLRAVHRVATELTNLEHQGVLTQAACPVCTRRVAEQPQPPPQQQQQDDAGQQQQQQQQPADSAAAGLSAAAVSFVPHKIDGDRNSKSAEAYQVGILMHIHMHACSGICMHVVAPRV
jgi:hypothetical protein